MSRDHAASEQRRVQRVEVDAGVSAEISVTRPARITEISSSGARIIVPAPLHLDTVHDLTITIADDTLHTKVRIVHCRLTDTSQGQPMYIAGVEFIDLSEASRRALDAAIVDNRNQ